MNSFIFTLVTEHSMCFPLYICLRFVTNFQGNMTRKPKIENWKKVLFITNLTWFYNAQCISKNINGYYLIFCLLNKTCFLLYNMLNCLIPTNLFELGFWKKNCVLLLAIRIQCLMLVFTLLLFYLLPKKNTIDVQGIVNKWYLIFTRKTS